MSNEEPLLRLGGVSFATTTAAFAELQRSTEWTWAEQARIGNTPALQFTGFGADTLTLPCVIYPGASGNAGTLSQLRTAADSGEPHVLVDARGSNHGQWVIKSISETYSAFLPSGTARKIEFSLTLARYATTAETIAKQYANKLLSRVGLPTLK